MTLRIGSTIADGIERVTNRNGALFALANVVLGLLWSVTLNSLVVDWLASQGYDTEAASALPTVSLPAAALALLGVVSLVVLAYLNLVAVRTFVGGHDRTIPREYFTRRIGWVFLNSVVVGLIFGTLALVGSILFVLPGLVVYVLFVFAPVYVVVEDENAFAALADSWRLGSGNRLRLFGLFAVVVGALVAVSVGVSEGASLLFGPLHPAIQLVTSALSVAISILTLGIIAEAFDRLRGEDIDASSATL